MSRIRAAVAAAVFVLSGGAGAEAAPVVATDIPPVHSIVARVMAGVGEPGSILPPGASPHGHALRPSEARLLQDAALVVWVGPALAPWLADPIETLAPRAEHLALQDVPGMTLLEARAGGPFEAHEDHGDAGHGDGHEHLDDHGEDHVDRHGGGPGTEGGVGVIDGHLWLDPGNGAVAAAAVAEALAALDPANAAAYRSNAAGFSEDLAAQAEAIRARLSGVAGRPYLVFHDGYQYFERAFAVPAAASVAMHDGDAPGTARLAAIRQRIADAGIVCAFSEPEFEPALLATVTEGTGVRVGSLDGLGATLEPGAGLYPALLDGIADDLAACLAP